MRHRLAIILPVYSILLASSLMLAFALRFDFVLDGRELTWLLRALPFVVAAKLAIIAAFREWRRSFRHASLTDGMITTSACITASLVFLIVHHTASFDPLILPRSVVVIDGMLSILSLLGFRFACRVIWSGQIGSERTKKTEKAFIYGTDETSIGIWKMVMASQGHLGKYRIVGFIDPGSDPQRSLIGGQAVHSLGNCWEAAKKTGVEHILIPTTISGRVVRQLLHEGKSYGIDVHKIPTVEEIVEGRFRLAVRDLDIDDLLRRPPAKLDLDSIGKTLSGKTVLVTGGAGSIGSELCRQIVNYKPARLIIYDHSEFGVFRMEREFAARDHPETEIRYITASILDEDALRAVFHRFRPEIVYHAAAYKHVPLMQDNPYAAVRNNFLGTKAVVDLADQAGAERFVLVSTDKAVRPTSVMGATKLLAEKYLQAMSQTSATKFITVRFGNVLNSVGSVVPIFREQIERGGPVTVTHPEMIRYFMTIPEAVQLVLQAGAVGKSGNVLILDMGEPVRIMDLAQDMIALSGLSYPEDIEIRFTGLRPGEKMYEELFYQHEQSAPKIHEKIILGSGKAPSSSRMKEDLFELRNVLQEEPEHVTTCLWEIVNRYVAMDDQREEPMRTAA